MWLSQKRMGVGAVQPVAVWSPTRSQTRKKKNGALPLATIMAAPKHKKKTQGKRGRLTGKVAMART